MLYLYTKHQRYIEAKGSSEFRNTEKFMKTPVRSKPLPEDAPHTTAEKNITTTSAGIEIADSTPHAKAGKPHLARTQGNDARSSSVTPSHGSETIPGQVKVKRAAAVNKA